MTSELIVCPFCKQEKIINYGDRWAINDDAVVSEEKCGCRKKSLLINGKKILDHALMIIKQNEVKNEKSISSFSKLSSESKASSKRRSKPIL